MAYDFLLIKLSRIVVLYVTCVTWQVDTLLSPLAWLMTLAERAILQSINFVMSACSQRYDTSKCPSGADDQVTTLIWKYVSKKIVSVCEARGWLQTSDFSFGAAHWWVTLSIAIFTSPICLIVISKQDVDHETGSTFRIETLPEVGRVTATSNVHRKFGKVGTCGLWDKLADRQTDRHRHRPTDYRETHHRNFSRLYQVISNDK